MVLSCSAEIWNTRTSEHGGSFYKITFWKHELWLSKSRVSITAWKTWKGSRHYTPYTCGSFGELEIVWKHSPYGLMSPLQFLVLPNFHSCFCNMFPYSCMETWKMFSISLAQKYFSSLHSSLSFLSLIIPISFISLSSLPFPSLPLAIPYPVSLHFPL